MSIYGIDLGTTNSLIGLHSKNFLSDIVPSCVNIETGEAGAKFFDDMSAQRSFKIDMSMGVEGILPRAASKFVLEELVRQVKDDVVKDVVISVPAYFNDSQRSATVAAAIDAGLDVKGLVNEPTAAAMYIARNKKSLFVVYDLGGGTFDVSIIDSRFGNYDVQATTGRIVGGDNFDSNIMRNFIKEGKIPIQNLDKEGRMSLQHFAAKKKIELQKLGQDILVDLKPWGGSTYLFKVDTYIALMKLTFGDTINDIRTLIKTYIPSSEKFEILLVGGSTHCPYLRKWIEQETGCAPEPLTYDPDRVVAQGAALYASILEQGDLDLVVSDVTKALSIGLADGTVDNIVEANSKIPLREQRFFKNDIESDCIEIELYQGNSMLRKDNELIGTLVYNFDKVMPAKSANIIVTIEIDSSGIIEFSANEVLKPAVSITLKR